MRKKRLDLLLVERGLAESRSQAQALVLAGLVPGYDKPGEQVAEDAELEVERPPRFVYELTASGHELAGALRLLADWGARHREGGEPPRHDACGTPVEARWWCPACEQPVGEEDATGLRYA